MTSSTSENAPPIPPSPIGKSDLVVVGDIPNDHVVFKDTIQFVELTNLPGHRPIGKSNLQLVDGPDGRPIEKSSMEGLVPYVPPVVASAASTLTKNDLKFSDHSPFSNRPMGLSTIEIADLPEISRGRPVFKSPVKFADHTPFAHRPLGASLVTVPEHSPLPNNRPIADNHQPGDDLMEYL